MKKRFSEEQIIGFLGEAEAGLPIKELCRRHGFSEASYYLWRSKFGGMSVPPSVSPSDHGGIISRTTIDGLRTSSAGCRAAGSCRSAAGETGSRTCSGRPSARSPVSCRHSSNLPRGLSRRFGYLSEA